MNRTLAFLTRRRDGRGWHPTDILSYVYLMLGVLMMFGPVVWLLMSSFKTQAGLVEFPPSFLPYSQEQVMVEGYKDPLPLFEVTLPDGSKKPMAQVRRIGIVSQMVDPKQPDQTIRVKFEDRTPIRSLAFAWENYVTPLKQFNFMSYLWNSIVVTTVATFITLVVNSMAAFGLSKYEFRGRTSILIFIIGTLMIPITVIMVPVYLVATQLGMVNSLWGVILPGAATPTGVFLLRQYMLTIPDELIDAARMDNASEWQIYWRLIVPLSLPAIAVLAIFSIMWRWNDFLWPLIILTRNEVYTLQVGLNAFQGELQVQWHFVLAMTVVTLLPITLVFAFLQKFITTGIASTGMK
ncbi:carbohydrate ABC transporter permease [Shumkonia mesophila]|uniref:carbohydrate ABC transporter permease n=1 Tax=Shumkonia mesophila TaxID=2838854 RepID=UPI0029345115|nr:carbohydrate ABC transporter permease [Shumkonia mesophila]